MSGNYNIAATYCEPDNGPSEHVQVLTHGIGFDRAYWDLPFHKGNYSYVNDAVAAGYSTFAWDRLGIAESEHGDPLSEIQALLEVDALRALTVALRAGDVEGISSGFDVVTHVGHSFGSQHTYALTAMYPDISDGITLTGFSQNGSFAGFFLIGGNCKYSQGQSLLNLPALLTFYQSFRLTRLPPWRIIPTDTLPLETNPQLTPISSHPANSTLPS